VVEHSSASALGEEEHSWDEVLEAAGEADIEASAALAEACKQALLEVEEEACMLALLVSVVCKPAWSSLAACRRASSEGEAADCMTELVCSLHKSALAEKEPWLGVECAQRG